MGKADMEFGSQADLIKNEAGMAVNAESSNKGILTRTESKRSEFETVRRVSKSFYRVFYNDVTYFGSPECQQKLSMGLEKGYVHVL